MRTTRKASLRLPSRLTQWCLTLLAVTALGTGAGAQVATNWIWFNDYNQSLQPVVGTHSNATVYNVRIGPGGPLKDVTSGEFVLAQIEVVATGGDGPDDFGASADADANTPAYNLFNGFVDVGGADAQPDDGIIGLRSSEMNVVTLIFTNLDASKKYFFRGTSVRGNNYNDRWAIYEIEGVASFINAHVDGSSNTNLFYQADGRFPAANLTPEQVVLNSGENRAGSLVAWDEINPGADGGFSIVQRQYIGPAPFGNPSAGPYGYALVALMLAEVGTPEPVTIITQPAAQTTVEEFRSFSLSVVAGGSPPPRYQWYKQGVGAIPGETARTFSIASATMSDSGDYFVVASNSINAVTSTVARVTVVDDTNAPTVVAAAGSASLDRVYVEFSERMDPTTATDPANYTISPALNLTGNPIVANDGKAVVLPTDPQTPGATYTVTATDVYDLALNPIAAPNNTAQFRAWVPTGCGGLTFEVYATDGSTAVTALTSDPDFPNNPRETFTLTTFATDPAWAGLSDADARRQNYGGRIRGLFIPPEGGRWKFYLRADDGAEIWLNPNGTSASGRTRICFVAGFIGGTFMEEAPGARTSAPIPLNAGQAYYIEALYKEGIGGDYCEVAAKLETDPTPAASLTPIPGSMLGVGAAPPDLLGPVTIVQQPANRTNEANTQATFTVVGSNVMNATICYQWQRSDDGGPFADIPGATRASYTTPYLTEADDDGDAYQVLVSVIGSGVTSAAATLKVTPDVTRPRVTRVLGINDTNIAVIFTEPMTGPMSTALDPTAYAIDNEPSIQIGEVVTNATNPLRLDIFLSAAGFPMTLGNVYTLRVSTASQGGTQVQDGSGNLIDPDPTLVDFRAQNFPGDANNLLELPTTGMLPLGALTHRGFAGRLVQVGIAKPNGNQNTESVLGGTFTNAAGELALNIAPLPVFFETNIINYNRYAPTGAVIGRLVSPESNFPGYTVSSPNMDNMTMELFTYLQLERGIYRFGVASDDGFRLSPATSVIDPNNSITVGEFNGGRGGALPGGETLFDFYVSQDGLYPFRLIWEQGNGGADLEWYEQDLTMTTPTFIPINADPPAPPGLGLAAQGGGGPPAFTPPCTAKNLSASLSGTNLIVTWPIAGGGNLFELQSTPSLSAVITWSYVPQIPQHVTGNKRVTIPLTAGQNRFYRLYKAAPPNCP